MEDIKELTGGSADIKRRVDRKIAEARERTGESVANKLIATAEG